MSSFQLLQEIGKGSHGRVYLGTWNSRVVAIKEISKYKHSVVRVINEVNIMHEMNTYFPNLHIPKIHHFEQDHHNMYIVMEHMPGMNGAAMLRDMKKTNMYPTTEVLKTWLYNICQVSCGVHVLGMLYNDFKPQNIILQDNQAYVVDFGSVRNHDASQALVGTPYFYAPEKCRRQYSFKSDIWSIGVTAYMLACGSHPYLHGQYDDLVELEHNLHINKLDFHLPQWDNHPDDIKELLREMLQKEERKRVCIHDVLSHRFFDECKERILH